MPDRRSLGSALQRPRTVSELSPEVKAFISEPRPNTHEGTESEPPVDESRDTRESSIREARSRRKNIAPSEPIKDKIMIFFSTRLEQATADALRKAYLERKLKKLPLQTQQEIIEAALQDWLRTNGFLE